MRRIKLVLDYTGTRFSGWQIQIGKDTVQARIEKALFLLTGEKVSVIASGRTDAGVHALAQVIHFDTNTEFDTVAYVRGTNNYLPDDIRVLSAEVVASDFHARYGATKKTYIYRVYVSNEERAVYLNRATRVNAPLSLTAMQNCCKVLIGEHDFTSFMSSGSSVKTTKRTIYDANIVEREGLFGKEYIFSFTANGFLYNMVRKMSAVLISVGQGKMDESDVTYQLENPSKTGLTLVAPACGLYLKEVEY